MSRDIIWDVDDSGSESSGKLSPTESSLPLRVRRRGRTRSGEDSGDGDEAQPVRHLRGRIQAPRLRLANGEVPARSTKPVLPPSNVSASAGQSADRSDQEHKDATGERYGSESGVGDAIPFAGSDPDMGKPEQQLDQSDAKASPPDTEQDDIITEEHQVPEHLWDALWHRARFRGELLLTRPVHQLFDDSDPVLKRFRKRLRQAASATDESDRISPKGWWLGRVGGDSMACRRRCQWVAEAALLCPNSLPRPFLWYLAHVGSYVHTIRLRHAQLDDLPEAAFPASLAKRLQLLWLSHNRLVELPESVGNMHHLKELNCLQNALRSLPSSIGSLRELTGLDVSSNCLQRLPESVGQCVALRHLNLERNRLRSFPVQLSFLQNLRFLNISFNRLTAFPVAVARLPAIRAIHANGNRIQSFPRELCANRSLEELQLCNNAISRLPPEIQSLTQLKALWLDWNRIQRIPVEIQALETTLLEFRVEGNPLRAPPREVACQGIGPTCSWIASRLDDGIDRRKRLVATQLQELLHDAVYHQVVPPSVIATNVPVTRYPGNLTLPSSVLHDEGFTDPEEENVEAGNEEGNAEDGSRPRSSKGRFGRERVSTAARKLRLRQQSQSSSESSDEDGDDHEFAYDPTIKDWPCVLPHYAIRWGTLFSRVIPAVNRWRIRRWERSTGRRWHQDRPPAAAAQRDLVAAGLVDHSEHPESEETADEATGLGDDSQGSEEELKTGERLATDEREHGPSGVAPGRAQASMAAPTPLPGGRVRYRVRFHDEPQKDEEEEEEEEEEATREHANVPPPMLFDEDPPYVKEALELDYDRLGSLAIPQNDMLFRAAPDPPTPEVAVPRVVSYPHYADGGRALCVRMNLFTPSDRRQLMARRQESVAVSRRRAKAERAARDWINSDAGRETIQHRVDRQLEGEREALELLSYRLVRLRHRVKELEPVEFERRKLLDQRHGAARRLRDKERALKARLRDARAAADRAALKEEIESIRSQLRNGLKESGRLRRLHDQFDRKRQAAVAADQRQDPHLRRAAKALGVTRSTIPMPASMKSQYQYEYIHNLHEEIRDISGLIERLQIGRLPRELIADDIVNRSIQEHVDETVVEMRRQFRLMRRVMFSWTKVGIRSVFDRWHTWLQQRRANRNKVARRTVEAEALTAASQEASKTMRAMERGKWEKQWDPFEEQHFYRHTETGEIARTIPEDRDYINRSWRVQVGLSEPLSDVHG